MPRINAFSSVPIRVIRYIHGLRALRSAKKRFAIVAEATIPVHRIAQSILAVASLAAIAPVAFPQGFSPTVAPGKMTVPTGFRVELVAAEPQVRQPVAIDFDERGRLWVMQYLQYPNPAGLKRIKVDRFSRTAYDRVPEPPPRGPKGADRLTIFEGDPKNPGTLKSHDFVSGLNLASAFAFGHGGVFVLQVPYLLFYPDRNRDDVPDGNPEVLVTGFGMEDAHSVANSLTWGPDGWLYGCQGSTVTASIRGMEFQQGVWRYHPITHKFELFCEGGGNSWGLDFDRHGNLLYSTNAGPNVMLHGIQGGYYWKSFGKHGALHNPYSYGYFDHVPHTNFRGGHVSVGGIVYRGDNFPAAFRDKYIAADLLGHAVYWHDLDNVGSSFRSKHGGELLLGNDTWFAPSDVCLGPDGCVYVADWCDKRTAHPDPDADWDRSNGRVYRIAFGKPPRPTDFDLAKKSTSELIALLSHPNDWHSRTARRILADRRDSSAIGPLRKLIAASPNPDLALQALWALYVSGGFEASMARELLDHPNEDIRRWTIRFLGDGERVESATGLKLAALAATDPSAVVRSQLACSAKRLPANDALPILFSLSTRDEDVDDPHIPKLLWWGIERHCMTWMTEVIAFVKHPEHSRHPLVRETILPRLIRRFAVEASTACDLSLAVLLSDFCDRQTLEALEQGFNERKKPDGNAIVDAKLFRVLKARFEKSPQDPTLIRLLARLGDSDALAKLFALCLDRRLSAEARAAAIVALGDSAPDEIVGSVGTLIASNEPDAVQAAALRVMSRVANEVQVRELLSGYARLSPSMKARLRTTMAGRKNWATMLLDAVANNVVPASDFSTEETRLFALHGAGNLDQLVRKTWGNVRGPTPEEKLAEVRRLNNDVRAPGGDAAKGKSLFTKHCGVCHKLFGEGGNVGPDLTHANRQDRDFLLVSLVDPSGVIRKEYLSYTVETTDGRVITGLIAEQSANTVTLVNAKAEKTTLRRDEIASLKESPVSIMPDNLYKQLQPEEIRDLFRYLQSPQR